MLANGSCLCGGVKYEISDGLGDITHCHCPTCRKAHGAAFSSVAAVDIENFKFTSGKDLLKSYESSPGKTRHFCSNCGSQIYAHRAAQNHYILRLGTLDDAPLMKTKEHIWISQKAAWYDVHASSVLPQYDEWSDDT
ncbi:GFA family protein [Pseudomonadota bacterium]